MSCARKGYDAEMVREELVIYVGQSRLVRGTNQRLQHAVIGLSYYLHGKHSPFKEIGL